MQYELRSVAIRLEFIVAVTLGSCFGTEWRGHVCWALGYSKSYTLCQIHYGTSQNHEIRRIGEGESLGHQWALIFWTLTIRVLGLAWRNGQAARSPGGQVGSGGTLANSEKKKTEI